MRRRFYGRKLRAKTDSDSLELTLSKQIDKDVFAGDVEILD